MSEQENAGGQHHKRLQWCEVCQANVDPEFGDLGTVCPICGNSMGGIVDV